MTQAHAAMAKEYVSRSPELRDRSIVIDPTREGVAAVSDAIRKRADRQGRAELASRSPQPYPRRCQPDRAREGDLDQLSEMVKSSAFCSRPPSTGNRLSAVAISMWRRSPAPSSSLRDDDNKRASLGAESQQPACPGL